jgi:hypothetical protein
MDDTVSFGGLAKLVEQKMKCDEVGLDPQHILPVLNILMEEMLLDIKQFGIDIIGLGRFEIRQLKDHGHNDINNHGSWIVSPGLKKMRMVLEPALKLMLIDSLSRRKSFPPLVKDKTAP